MTLDELTKESDVVSLHCPLTEENRRMIDEKAIARDETGGADYQHGARRAGG